jgi:hypothetical protein
MKAIKILAALAAMSLASPALAQTACVPTGAGNYSCSDGTTIAPDDADGGPLFSGTGRPIEPDPYTPPVYTPPVYTPPVYTPPVYTPPVYTPPDDATPWWNQ